ncbi:MAG: hypothetical protein M1830_001464 [Pleopsidium flavum]|nr:MAG: hypothetical protein M1830_001464 [Pleopsidium flavum]
MANKSFTTKGLSRQLEDKANTLQTNLDALRKEHAQLREKFEDSVRLAARLQEKVDGLEKETGMREHKLQDQLELVQHERESANARLEQVLDELRNKKEEKDLLQTRHDALTTESQSLQMELRKAQATLHELEADLKYEQQHALDNERAVRDHGKDEMERLTDDIDDIRRELRDKESQFAAEQDHWENLRRGLESQREKAEEQAAGLKRTIQKLQESEGTLSSREMKLQEALESEKQRHDSEEAVLNRQIQELNSEIDTKRQAFEEARLELTRVKEELRLSKREEHNLNEKIQGLEDEIEILQSSLDEEAGRTKVDVSAARQEAEGLRRQLHTAKQDLAKADAAHADARVEIETFQGDYEAGQGSKEQLSSRLRDVEAQLQKVRTDKQRFQEELASRDKELQPLRASAAEIEADRDEMKIQLEQLQDQVDEKFRYDQEKIDLRKAKLRLESDLARLREERKGLTEKNEAIEKDLEAEIERAGSEEGRLSIEVADLRKRVAVLSEGKDRELNAAKQKVQRLELRVEELENHLQSDNVGEDAAAELSVIRRDLSAARKKETDYLQREASHKETIRDLKHNIADLERQLHEMEITKLVVDSPRSSVGGSARKTEVIEVRRQLAEAHQQMKDLRSKAKEVEREAQRKVAALERESRARSDAFDHDGEVLEQEIADCRLQQEEQLAKNTSAEQTIGRLRTKIQRLEKDLHDARLDKGDRTIAEERKDLHEMLKDAKLEVEDLQLQMSARDAKIQSFVSREKELRTQLKRVREERGQQRERANAATAELENLQSRYERAVADMASQQQVWEEERHAITHRVRFPNMSISSLPEGNSTEFGRLEQKIQEKEKRHKLELNGLVKHIQYLRAKCCREEGFRTNLAYEKKYFLLQIKMYDACNLADLQILQEMGVAPRRKPRKKKRPSLRSVVFMVVAGVRMKKMQVEWAVNKKLHTAMCKKLQQVRRQRKSIDH